MKRVQLYSNEDFEQYGMAEKKHWIIADLFQKVCLKSFWHDCSFVFNDLSHYVKMNKRLKGLFLAEGGKKESLK